MCASRTDDFRTIIAGHSHIVNQRQTRKTSPWQQEASALAGAVLELNHLVASVGPEYVNPSSRKLSEADKDALDSQVTSLLRRAFDRLGALEAAHQRDAVLQKSSPTSSSSFAETLFSAWLPPDPSLVAAKHRASHRQQLLLALSARLESCSRAHADIHDLRTKRRLERTNPHRVKGRKSDIEHTFLPPPTSDPSQPDIDDILTPAQMQQFQSESDALLQSAQRDLEAVQRAESTIQDIAQLHSSLVHHLTLQSAHTDQLYDDAFSTAEKLHAGNLQLKEARDRNRESRLMLLVFLIGASLTLLFVELY